VLVRTHGIARGVGNERTDSSPGKKRMVTCQRRRTGFNGSFYPRGDMCFGKKLLMVTKLLGDYFFLERLGIESENRLWSLGSGQLEVRKGSGSGKKGLRKFTLEVGVGKYIGLWAR